MKKIRNPTSYKMDLLADKNSNSPRPTLNHRNSGKALEVDQRNFIMEGPFAEGAPSEKKPVL